MTTISRNPEFYKSFPARFNSKCNICRKDIEAGEMIFGTKYYDDIEQKEKWDIICDDCLKKIYDDSEVITEEPSVLDEKALEEVDMTKISYSEYLRLISIKSPFKIN